VFHGQQAKWLPAATVAWGRISHQAR